MSSHLIRRFIAILLLLTVANQAGCRLTPSTISGPRLNDVRIWAYQIQEESASIDAYMRFRYDLLVIDDQRTIKDKSDVDMAGQVARLKRNTALSLKHPIVMCYLNVGEAEEWRWYWKDGWRVGSPDWIAASDPDGWDGNYPVKFWRDEWKSIVRSYLDRAIADGFDGAYLDWLEVYSFDPIADAAKADGRDARRELILFVTELAEYARAKKPGFLLIAQNAAEMGTNAEYRAVFDGIAQEAVWYDGTGDPDTGNQLGDVRVDKKETDEVIRNLRVWQDFGKPVFDVEYALKKVNADRAYDLGRRQRFRTFVTGRLLDAPTKTPPSNATFPAGL